MAKRSFPKFNQLWLCYPSNNQPCDQKKADGTNAWDNQCAIRVSITLEKAGFALPDYTDTKCKHGHARGAESLANYLWKQVGRPDTNCKKSDVIGKKGILFFKDITGFRGGMGDHIDLWNGSKTQTGEYFNICKSTWFWEIAS
jgi:hypothetical protein